MPSSKISGLTAVVTPVSTDGFVVNQGGVTKRETRAQIHTLEVGEHFLLPLENDAGSPSLGFGGGGDGFYQRTDTTLSVALAGAWAYNFSTTNLSAVVSGAFHASLRTVSPSATVPSIVPSVVDSSDTGIGLAAAGQLSLIAGGSEIMRLLSSGNVGVGTPTPDEIAHIAKAVDGPATLLLLENSQANSAASTNETVGIEFGFGGINTVARISADKMGDYTTTAEEDSRLAFQVDINGTLTMIAHFMFDGLMLMLPNSRIRFSGDAGGGGQAIQYKDTGNAMRNALMFPGSNVVALMNRAADGVVEIRANTAVGGSGGEVTVATFQDNLIKFATNIEIGSEGGGTRRLAIKGSDATGTAEGGEMQLFLADDFDTTIASYSIDAFEDDLRFFGAGGTPNMTLTAEGYLVLTSAAKTTTGDPASREGMIYWNTVDNVIRMFADGAWRTLASW